MPKMLVAAVFATFGFYYLHTTVGERWVMRRLVIARGLWRDHHP